MNTLITEKDQGDWFLKELFDQNLTKSAGKWTQPLRPKKLIPSLFWAIPINFRSKNKIKRLKTIKKSETIRKLTIKIEKSVCIRNQNIKF